MNGLDWTAVVVIAAGIVLGYYRGLVSQVVSVAGLIIAYVVAFAFYKEVSPWIAGALSLPAYESYRNFEFLIKGMHLDTYMYNAIAFALLLFGVKFALGIVGRVLNWIALTPGLKSMNQWSGALLGMAEASVLLVIAVQVMTVIPNDTVQDLLKGSQSAPYILNALPAVSDKLHELWQQQTKSV
ncbi:CvpA family protein [Paenibacillus doosanensis]|uniref:Colicin V production protein n=1 Tax=Paenibacillus konkukensis TaxID=2020716 RepID=A0ABY4RUB0_9BACL|nr:MULTISPECIES: CvpA family protein [Paenibacillus]MCS7460791.1 CvpA family protein [Paenibacillus doosanensis]UQZ85971.1 Colicin V production protein [Paenibacillus konkukensis]